MRHTRLNGGNRLPLLNSNSRWNGRRDRIKAVYRDVKISNLAIYQVHGVLIIFEPALYIDAENRGNDMRVGAAPFLAREVFGDLKEKSRRGLYHDLETVFYILVYHSLGYEKGRLPLNGADLLQE